MAATIQIHEMTTDIATGVDKTGANGPIRFKASTSTAVDVNDPLEVPASGTNYSYVKKLRPYMSVAPGVLVKDFEWYTDGSAFMLGVGVTAKNIGTTFGTHYTTQMSGGADLFSYLVGAPLAGSATDAGPFVPADNDSYIGDVIELQMSVSDLATNGALPAKTLTLAYSEI